MARDDDGREPDETTVIAGGQQAWSDLDQPVSGLPGPDLTSADGDQADAPPPFDPPTEVRRLPIRFRRTALNRPIPTSGTPRRSPRKAGRSNSPSQANRRRPPGRSRPMSHRARCSSPMGSGC